MDVSRETSERLREFAAMVLKWNPVINLISKSTSDDIWDRHIQDSLQLYTVAGEGRHWADLGSGGGFPGVVVAIAGAEKHPQRHFTLVEADQRKAAFLREAVRVLYLNADVLNQRIEAVPALNADILSARALAPLTSLLEHTERHLGPEGVAIFPKGVQNVEEIAAAHENWQFSPVIHPSVTSDSGVILEVRNLARV